LGHAAQFADPKVSNKKNLKPYLCYIWLNHFQFLVGRIVLAKVARLRSQTWQRRHFQRNATNQALSWLFSICSQSCLCWNQDHLRSDPHPHLFIKNMDD
jgi:hypothetical protein